MKNHIEFKASGYDYNNPITECYNYEIDKAYEFATETLGIKSSVNMEIVTDGKDVVRITAILPNDLGYDFSEQEIKKALK